jgi:hypothetical protein
MPASPPAGSTGDDSEQPGPRTSSARLRTRRITTVRPGRSHRHYLHLGFTNATAFSPTDVLPLSRRAKYMMLVQSTVSLALFGLVVARAVNVFK